MTSCQSCGKLIASGTAEHLCRACRDALHGRKRETPAPKLEPPLDAAQGPDLELCVRCRRYPILADSEFCLSCNLELVASLGDAAEEVFRHPPEPPKPPVASPASLMSDIDEKRDRTATSHMRMVGGARLK